MRLSIFLNIFSLHVHVDLQLNRLQEAKLVYGQLLKEDPKSRIATANMQLITERMKEEAKKEQKAKEEAEKDSKKKTKTPTNKYVSIYFKI